MLTKSQSRLMGCWILGPFAVLIFLILINPAYEGKLFIQFNGIFGMSVLIVIQVVNALLLYVGLKWANRRSETAVRSHTRTILVAFVSILTMFLCTLPAFWIVIFWPSVVILLQQGLRGSS